MDNTPLNKKDQNSLLIQIKTAKKWRIFLYVLLLFKFVFCILVLSFDAVLCIEGLGITKKYLGFVQSVADIILIIFLSLSIIYNSKTLVLVYIVSADILSMACGIMFILLELSADIQYYNGEAPLQPAHTKLWFKIYNLYFIFSLTLSAFTIMLSFFAYQVRKNISFLQKNLLIQNSNHSRTYTSSTKSKKSRLVKESFVNPTCSEEEQKNKNIFDNNLIAINTFFPFAEINKNEENNEKQSEKNIQINESLEKSFQNSLQSSKKIRLVGNSQVVINSGEKNEDFISEPEESPRFEVTKTVISEFNKQDIENYLLDTPEGKNLK